jgi:hypothetical protein
MLIDALQLLTMAGFPIRDYQYTGMGSIYFVDYILFHKFLGIERMTSVEAALQIRRRVEFNRPFRLVDVQMARVGDYIPELSADLQHLLWLAYDTVLSVSHLQDIALAGTYLPPGSIILVTVDAEPPVPVISGGAPEKWRDFFADVAPEYVDPSWGIERFALSNLVSMNAQLIERALRSGIVGRQHVMFMPLFFFEYADGNRMVTVGGMVATAADRRRVAGSRLREAVYFRGTFEGEPFRIRIPKLTRKERLFLDSEMPSAESWSPESFELDEDDVTTYSEIYRFFPAYAELLL